MLSLLSPAMRSMRVKPDGDFTPIEEAFVEQARDPECVKDAARQQLHAALIQEAEEELTFPRSLPAFIS
jgi:hypothetical protein